MKKWTVLLVTLTLLFTLAACGSEENSSAGNDADPPQVEDVQTNGSDAEEQTFTGTLEDKTNFMLVVTSEDGSSYIFDLEDELVSDAQIGDQVTITYTGDLSTFDPAGENGQLIASKVELAQ